MEKSNIKSSAFGLAKGAELLSDDYFDIGHFANTTVAVLCDGVGSAKEGRTASKEVVNYLLKSFELKPNMWDIPQALEQFINSINTILYSRSEMEYGSPQYITTLTIVVIEGNRLYGANVGDSRVYLLRDNKLHQLSTDHTLDNEENSHVLIKAVGLSKDIEPYFFENNLRKDDYILLCSDGVYNEVDEKELIEHIPLFAKGIVKYINKKSFENLSDDTSAIVLKINEEDEVEKQVSKQLTIPEELNEDDDIDGYVLKKSLIQNRRTWLAEKDGEKVVIKFPSLSVLDSKEELNLFVREAWNAKRLNPKHMPKAYIPEDRTYRYYILEYVEGENLEEYISKNDIDISEATQVLQVLLENSQYLLNYNLAHGDIKPENIIRTKEGKFYIVDYGSIVDIFSITNRAGTPSYLSPERFQSAPISEQSEIFAIGVTIYRILTKQFPYGEIEPFQTPTFAKPPKPPKELNHNVPEWFNNLILRMVHKDTSIRYRHFSEVDYDLKHPDKVQPILNRDAPLLERDPLKFYKIGFWIMAILNILQLVI